MVIISMLHTHNWNCRFGSSGRYGIAYSAENTVVGELNTVERWKKVPWNVTGEVMCTLLCWEGEAIK